MPMGGSRKHAQAVLPFPKPPALCRSACPFSSVSQPIAYNLELVSFYDERAFDLSFIFTASMLPRICKLYLHQHRHQKPLSVSYTYSSCFSACRLSEAASEFERRRVEHDWAYGSPGGQGALDARPMISALLEVAVGQPGICRQPRRCATFPHCLPPIRQTTQRGRLPYTWFGLAAVP